MTPFRPSSRTLAVLGVGVCALIWGTTWYGITLQLGTVDPIASIVWRFGLAAVALFGVSALMRQPLRLTRVQHLAALGQGVFAFSISYSFTYAAEGHVASAIVAVVFAALTFLNLVLFRVKEGQRASPAAWGAAVLGVVGVAVLSGGEILGAGLDHRAALGIGLALIATTASAFGNYFAWRGQQRGSQALPATAWAMAWGTALLALYGLVTGVEFTIEPTARYIGSLLYLWIGDRLRHLFHHRPVDRLRHGQLCLGPDAPHRHAGVGAVRGRALRLDRVGRAGAGAGRADAVEPRAEEGLAKPARAFGRRLRFSRSLGLVRRLRPGRQFPTGFFGLDAAHGDQGDQPVPGLGGVAAHQSSSFSRRCPSRSDAARSRSFSARDHSAFVRP